MKKAIVTICIGDEFEKISKLTHPTLKKYADKIGADFLNIIKCKTTPHWEKFILNELLNKYDRIIYLDTDLIVRDDCPDLFQIVPYNQIGAFNEAKFVPREYSLIETAKFYNIDTQTLDWDGRYFNTGVLVISKCHKYVFEKPEEENCNFYEQGYLNLRFCQIQTKRNDLKNQLIFELSYKFNRMTCLDFSGEIRYASYIVHYAGYHYFTTGDEILSIIQRDLNIWEEDKPEYFYKRKIVLVVSGGMGDQVCAEPVLRYIKKVYKDTADIVVTTHWPRLFEHLDFPVFAHSEFEPKKYLPFYRMLTFPDPTTITYSVISNLLCHTVDYCAIATLQRVLPLTDKIIQLQKTEKDEKELDLILDGFDLSKAILIHPGRHWDSKTFPKKWWQEVVNKISKEIPVCLIGTDNHENRGAFQLDLPENSINLIDRTSIGGLIVAISRAPVLVSNDSVPVHIAGAFDNWIILIPSCKHPDHVLPFRKTSEGIITSYHKAEALYQKLTLDDCDQRPTTWIEGGATAENVNGPWENYIPTSEEVYSRAILRFKQLLR